RDVKSEVIRPEKELKGFEKVFLQPNESKTVTFTLNKRSFAYYNTKLSDWHVETGEFDILIGQSSRDIALKDRIHITSTVAIKQKVHRNTVIGDLLADPILAPATQEFLEKMNENNPFGSEEDNEMISRMINYVPLRTSVNTSQGF